MTDNTSAVPHSEDTSISLLMLTAKAKKAACQAAAVDTRRDFYCVSKSPRECLVLTFAKLDI
jgi:hypothetical protein